MTTMISNLPRDLVEEILSRVPLKCMRAVRLTCKKWDIFSKSRSFLEMHIDKAAAAPTKETEYRLIMLMDYNLHLMSVTINENPSLESKSKLSCLNEQVKISEVVHYEGLLLCILEYDSRIVVWNPYLGQTRWIEPSYSHNKHIIYRYALGYVNNKKNKSCRNHKILRFLDFLGSSDCEIYDFNSGLWTTLDVTPTSNWDDLPFHQWYGVSLKGNNYWCATKSNSEGRLNDHIICFDFTKERFRRLLCFPVSAMSHEFVTLSCVREEKLAALRSLNEINPYEMDIWITTKIEAEKVSWSKFLTLNAKFDHYPISSKSLFIDEEKKIAMGFDEYGGYDHHIFSVTGEDGYLKQFNLGKHADKDSSFSGNMCFYVPSLVQIKQDAKASI